MNGDEAETEVLTGTNVLDSSLVNFCQAPYDRMRTKHTPAGLNTECHDISHYALLQNHC